VSTKLAINRIKKPSSELDYYDFNLLDHRIYAYALTSILVNNLYSLIAAINCYQ